MGDRLKTLLFITILNIFPHVYYQIYQDNFISNNFIISDNNPMDSQLFNCYL